MFALAELQLWLHAEAEPRSPGTRHGPCVLHLFSRDHSTGTKPAELVQGRGTEACSPWLGWTKLLQGGHSKTKPRKDGVWVLADFQGDGPPWEGPGARKRHGAFPCHGRVLPVHPTTAPHATQGTGKLAGGNPSSCLFHLLCQKLHSATVQVPRSGKQHKNITGTG